MASLNSGSARSSEWYPNIITEKEARLIAKKIMQSASSANIDLPFVKQFETEGYSPATIIGARRELADQVNSGKGIEISDKEYQQMKDYFQQFEMSHIQSEVYKYATESDFPFIVEKSKVYVVPGGRRISDTDAQGYARIILDEAKQRGFVLPAIERWLSEGYSPKNVLEAYEEAFYLNSHGKPQVSSEYRDKLLRYLWRLIPSMEQIAVYKESVSSADPLIRRFTVIELCQWLKLTFPGSYDIVVYDGPVAESSKVLYNKCGLKAPNTPFNLAANPDIEVKIDENLARVYFLMEDDKRLYRVMWSCRAQDVQRNYVGQLVQVLYNAARHIQKPEQEVKRSPEMATNIFEMKFTLDELYKWVKAKYSDSGSFSVTKSWSHSYENIFDGELLDRTYARKFFTLSKKLEMRVNRTKYEQGGVGEFISFHLDQDGNEYVANLHLNKTRQDTGYINDIVPLLLKSADVAFSSSNRIAKKDNLLNRTFSLLELADWFKANFPKADDLSVTGDGYIFEGGQVFEGGKVKAAAAYKSRLFELGDQIEYELFRHSATNIMKFRIVGKTRVYKVHFRFKVNADTKTYISTLIQAISDAGGIPFKASKRKNEESMKSNRKKLSAGGTVSSIESPMIYVADLEAYNQGKLVGDWLDLSFYSSGSEVTEAISELLAKWSEEQGVKREEYAIHDMENVPSGLLSDGAGEAEFEKVIRLYEKADEMDVPMDVLLEAMKDTGNDDLDNIQEMYQGRYRDKEAFGQHLQEDGLVTDVSPFLSMRETDRTIAANEMADQEVGEMRDDKLISEADMDDELEELDDKQSAKDDLTEQIEGLESEVDELKDLEDAASPADARAIHANRLQKELELAGKKAELEELASFDYDKEKDALVERAKAQVQSDLFDKAYAGMKDPVAYFVDEQGLYTRENLGEQNFIVVDYEALADDSLSDYVVVEHDGELYVFNGSYAKGGKLPSDSSGKGGLRDEIVKLIRTELQDEKDDHQEHLLIVESLRPLEGKKFTMRAQGLLPAGFTLFTDINGYEVKSPRGRNHNIVRHSDTASFSISKLNDYNAPYNAGAKQRSEKLQKLLESQAQLEKVVEVFVELKAAYDDLEKAIASIEPYDSFNFPTYYDALRLCGIDSSRISDIKYKRMEKGGILALNSDADMEEFKRKFKKMVEDDLQTEIDDHNEFLLLVEALKPLEGKKFTMRAQTKLPEGYVLRKDFNGFVVTSPRGKKHNIIRDSDSANFTIAKFADYDGPYNAGSKGRIEKLRRFTDSPKKMQAVIAAFASLCRAYHRFVAAVDEAESHDAYNFPAYYDVLRLLKIDSNLMSEIRFRDNRRELGGTAEGGTKKNSASGVMQEKINEYSSMSARASERDKLEEKIKSDYIAGRLNAATLWQVLSGDGIVSGKTAAKIYIDLGFIPHEGYPLKRKDGTYAYDAGGQVTNVQDGIISQGLSATDQQDIVLNSNENVAMPDIIRSEVVPLADGGVIESKDTPLKRLGEIYQTVVGYNIVEDDPSMSREELISMMKDYDDESEAEGNGRPFSKFGVYGEVPGIDLPVDADGTVTVKGYKIQREQKEFGVFYTVPDNLDYFNSLTKDQRREMMATIAELNEAERKKRQKRSEPVAKKLVSYRFADFKKSQWGEGQTIRNYLDKVEQKIKSGVELDEGSTNDYQRYLAVAKQNGWR